MIKLFGTGEKANPYEISSIEDLIYLSKTPKIWNKHFIQKGDINAAGIEIFPIGRESWLFTGSFDGNGMEIKNLTINLPAEQGVGLFGYLDVGAEIECVTLHNANIAGLGGVGGIAGCNEGGSVKFCEVNGRIQAEEIDSAGIAVGVNYDGGTVYGCIGECVIITDKEETTDEKIVGYNKEDSIFVA